MPPALVGPYVAISWNVVQKHKDPGMHEDDRHLFAALIELACSLFIGWMVTISIWQTAMNAGCSNSGPAANATGLPLP